MIIKMLTYEIITDNLFAAVSPMNKRSSVTTCRPKHNCGTLNYENKDVLSHVLETVKIKSADFWCECRVFWYRTTKVSE
jgi:nitrogenase subunit NifH